MIAGPAEDTAIGNLLVLAQATGALEPGLPALRAVVAASFPTRRYDATGSPSLWTAAERRLPASLTVR